MKNSYCVIFEGKLFFSWEDLIRHSNYSFVLGNYYATGIKTPPPVIEIPITPLLLILYGYEPETIPKVGKAIKTA